jgi:hypothetical protein
LEGTSYPNSWGVIDLLRDSSGYILNGMGDVILSSTVFGETFSTNTIVTPSGDSLYTVEFQMIDSRDELQVPAGLFPVINAQGTITRFDDNPNIPSPRIMDNYYAEDLGRVLNTVFYFNSPTLIEKRLLRFNIE